MKMYVLVLRSREPISYGEEAVGIKTLIKRISILLPEQGEILQVPVIFCLLYTSPSPRDRG